MSEIKDNLASLAADVESTLPADPTAAPAEEAACSGSSVRPG